MTIQVNITPTGRMNLPAAIRKRLGLGDGGTLFIEEAPDAVVLRTTSQVVSRAQAIARRFTADKADASVDAFLANRSTESGE